MVTYAECWQGGGGVAPEAQLVAKEDRGEGHARWRRRCRAWNANRQYLYPFSYK